MSPTATVLLSLLIAFVVLAGITVFVSSRVRRSSSVATRAATQAGVSFVVCARRWQSALLRWTGILFVVVGCVLLLISVLGGDNESTLGAGIPGVFIAIGGFCFVWIARGVARARLEVTPDAIWQFRWRGAPRQIPISEISRLAPMSSNNYGGLVARSDKHRLFSVNRLMLGYPQLIEFLHTNRPDLAIPDASLPL